MSLKNLLSNSRYIIILPVAMSLIASLAAFIWGAAKTVMVIYSILLSIDASSHHAEHIELIAVMDLFLIATALFIFALGMYELFIEELEYPQWLVIKDLHSLKAKLSSVIILVMAVSFLERLTRWPDAYETLMYAGAIALVSAVLIAFAHFGGKD